MVGQNSFSVHAREMKRASLFRAMGMTVMRKRERHRQLRTACPHIDMPHGDDGRMLACHRQDHESLVASKHCNRSSHCDDIDIQLPMAASLRDDRMGT